MAGAPYRTACTHDSHMDVCIAMYLREYAHRSRASEQRCGTAVGSSTGSTRNDSAGDAALVDADGRRTEFVATIEREKGQKEVP